MITDIKEKGNFLYRNKKKKHKETLVQIRYFSKNLLRQVIY